MIENQAVNGNQRHRLNHRPCIAKRRLAVTDMDAMKRECVKKIAVTYEPDEIVPEGTEAQRGRSNDLGGRAHSELAT